MLFIKIVLGIAIITGLAGTVCDDNKKPYEILFIAGVVLYLVCLKMGG